ncbi:MAG: helix-turn-helix transcriptional regulator [Ruminococcaceae bacterium]|nr:helix-turn-helix transcriptional regulator [Oscillospiraceae bacterium]
MEILLPEIVSAGIYNTDIAVKNKAMTKSRKTTMFEIEIPMEDGGISYIDSLENPIRTNTVICAKPGQTRHTKLPFKCYYIHMILTGGELSNTLLQIPDFVRTDNSGKYYELFKKISKYFGSGLKEDEIILHSTVLELIHTLYHDSEKIRWLHNEKSNNRKVIEGIIAYIKENLTSDLSLDTISKKAGFSPIHFHNCFKASTGKTLRDYVEEQRIKKAVNMLWSTNNTLTEIAYFCGFSSQSYFSYAFKRKMGMTPRDYAVKILKQYDETANHTSQR